MNEWAFAIFGASTEFSPALTKLVETIAPVFTEPAKIRRVADAKAYEMRVLAEAEVDRQDILYRGVVRLENKEARRQRNAESVVKIAAQQVLLHDSKPNDQPVDEDWIFDFFDKCQDVGNEEMQAVWARMLVGEVASPGSFSLRAIQAVKLMRPSDAKVFTELCSFRWTIETDDRLVVPRFERLPSFEIILKCDSIGLIHHQIDANFVVDVVPDKLVSATYFGRPFQLKLPLHSNELPIGSVVLTDIGRELCKIAGGEQNDDTHIEDAIQYWKNHNIQGVAASEISTA